MGFCGKVFFSRRLIVAAVIAVFFPGTGLLRSETPDGQPPVTVRLVSSQTAIVPGKPLDVGVLLEMAPGWHTYWAYSGDAGLPTKIDWKLPEGFAAGPIQWPAPEGLLEPGDIQTYAYGGRVLLITKIAVPPGVKGEVKFQAGISWLACQELCVPGSAEVGLSLPVAPTSVPANAELFTTFRARLPADSPPPYPLTWSRDAQFLQLHIAGLPTGTKAELFPLPGAAQNVGHPRIVSPGTLRIEAESPFRGVLAVGDGPARKSWFVSNKIAPPAAGAPASPGLWMALIYGFLGGLILNLMPCVLPVISLKIFGFIRQADANPRKIFAHGLAFMAGIFSWFLALGLLVVGLKSGGTEVTWAFQFQNPWFNIVIGSLVFVFALNLFGVFEVVLPGRATTALESAGATGGLGGSFFQGVFATLLATPCSAPYLGTALGFAFVQPGPVILAMFGAVASGMALPYLLLTANPRWMKFLPRPGAWMERFKQLMGFPLLATLVWIFAILGGQRGSDGVVSFAAFLLCLAVACWLYGSFCGPLSLLRTRMIALLLAVAFVGGGGWFFLSETKNKIPWVPFTESELARARSQNRPVFVDFTADWCITCKFNERTAINTAAVRRLLAEKRVVPVRADWTNANPEIAAALKTFGRVAVPFYVLYPAGKASDPIVLPELLTESLLVGALKKLP